MRFYRLVLARSAARRVGYSLAAWCVAFAIVGAAKCETESCTKVLDTVATEQLVPTSAPPVTGVADVEIMVSTSGSQPTLSTGWLHTPFNT